MDHRYAIGTDDPRSISAANDAAAIAAVVTLVCDRHTADLRDRPEAVMTLMGPNGLVTGPSERLDAFVERRLPANPVANPDRLQPGDASAPDCNAE